MRKTLALALLAGLAVVRPAHAQRSLSSFGSVNPSQIVNRPIDLSQTAAPVAPDSSRLFGLDNFFSRIHIPGLPQRVGVSPMPLPSSYPSTRYRSPISPAPIINSSR
jgi:hypothetical protein